MTRRLIIRVLIGLLILGVVLAVAGSPIGQWRL